MRLFKAEAVFLVCFLLVIPLTAISFEEDALEDADYFPTHNQCHDTGKQSFYFFSLVLRQRKYNAFSFLLPTVQVGLSGLIH